MATLETAADANGRTIAARFREVQEALQVNADLWEPWHDALIRRTLAARDCAAFRVRPGLTGRGWAAGVPLPSEAGDVFVSIGRDIDGDVWVLRGSAPALEDGGAASAAERASP